MSSPRDGDTHDCMGVHRAFIHLVEVGLVLVDPPQIWQELDEILRGCGG